MNLKMPSFSAVFNCSNCADIEKDRLITVFSQLLKIMVKKLETFESEKGKVVSSNFHKIFN